MTTGRFFGFLLFAVVMAAAGYGASYWYQHDFDPSTEPAPPDQAQKQVAKKEIQAQGRLEPAGGTIAVSALPGEQIVELKVKVGDQVAANTELAILGSKKIREAEKALAKEQEVQTKIKRDAELLLSAERIKAATLAVKLAEARKKELPPDELLQVAVRRKELAADQLKQLEQLRDNPATRDAITDGELKQQQLLIEQLTAEIEHNQNKGIAATDAQKLAVAAAKLDLDIAHLAEKSIKDADPAAMLSKSTELTRLTAEATTVRAPSKGKILQIYTREGERVANTPVLLMGDLEQMICIAEVHEASLKSIKTKMKNGKLVPDGTYPVTIRSVALEVDLKGTVMEVGQLIGAPKLRDPNPLARSDHRSAQVKIKLDKEYNEAARRFVHLQVNVTMHLE